MEDAKRKIQASCDEKIPDYESNPKDGLPQEKMGFLFTRNFQVEAN